MIYKNFIEQKLFRTVVHSIDNNMPFTTFNFFATIKAFVFCRATRFDTL